MKRILTGLIFGIVAGLIACAFVNAADVKVSELTAMTTPTDDDLMMTVNDPGGTPASNKITWANIKATLKTYFDSLYTGNGVVNTDSTPDANGEWGYASNAYTWFANSEDFTLTASANTWTASSSTGVTSLVLSGMGITASNFTAAKSSGVAGDQGLYEANSTDTDAAGWRGPTALSDNTSYRFQFPTAKAAAKAFLTVTNSGESGSGTAADPYVQAMSLSTAVIEAGITTITKSEYLPIRYAEDDDSVTAPAAATEVGTTTAIARSFVEDADNGVVFWWHVPLDYSAGIKYRVYYAIQTDADADETVAFALSGCSNGNTDAMACSEGTAVNVADELTTDYDANELIVSDWSTAVTVSNIAVGEMAKLLFIRDVSEDDYDDASDNVLVIAIEIKYQAKINASGDY